MMCVPLIDADRNSIGAIQIDTISDRDRFRDEDLEVLVAELQRKLEEALLSLEKNVTSLELATNILTRGINEENIFILSG